MADRINMGDWTGDHLSDDEIATMMLELENYAVTIETACRPANKTEILQTLADFADMLQVAVPGDAGIDLYLAALDNLPKILLPTAAKRVAQTHRFARLPLPSDFLSSVAGEIAYCTARRAWPRGLIDRLSKIETRRRRDRRTFL